MSKRAFQVQGRILTDRYISFLCLSESPRLETKLPCCYHFLFQFSCILFLRRATTRRSAPSERLPKYTQLSQERREPNYERPFQTPPPQVEIRSNLPPPPRVRVEVSRRASWRLTPYLEEDVADQEGYAHVLQDWRPARAGVHRDGADVIVPADGAPSLRGSNRSSRVMKGTELEKL